jgi:hypothetical protein
MTSSTWTHRLAALLTAVIAIGLLAGTAVAGNSRPAGMSKAEYRALMLRSQALDEKYGLGEWAAKPPSMSHAEFRALMIRSRALNEKYGVGVSKVTTPAPRVAAPVVARDGFVWGDFAIGAAAMLGLVLLVAGLVAGGRHGRGVLRTRSSS